MLCNISIRDRDGGGLRLLLYPRLQFLSHPRPRTYVVGSGQLDINLIDLNIISLNLLVVISILPHV